MKTIQEVLCGYWRECRVGNTGLEFARDVEMTLEAAGYVITQKPVGAALLGDLHEQRRLSREHMIAQNFVMGSYDLMLQVGGLKDEREAKQFADALAEWMTETGGWKAKVQ